MAKNSPKRHFDYAIITGLLMLFLFTGPFFDWWTRLHLPWFLPYVLWLLVILLTAFGQWRNPEQ